MLRLLLQPSDWDGIGRVQLAWDSNATGHLGVWSQAVDPATGAPSRSPRLMPGSVTSYNGAPNHSQMLQRTPLVGLPDDQSSKWRLLDCLPGRLPGNQKSAGLGAPEQ